MLSGMLVEACSDPAGHSTDEGRREDYSPTNNNPALSKGNLHSRGDSNSGHDNSYKEGIMEDAPDFEKAKKEVPTACGGDGMSRS